MLKRCSRSAAGLCKGGQREVAFYFPGWREFIQGTGYKYGVNKFFLILPRWVSNLTDWFCIRSLTGITLGFPPETVVEIITLDGGLSVEMKQADVGKSAVGIIYPGQRVDFVLRPAKNRESWMAVKLDES